MGLMNAIGLQPRNPTTSVTSQGTQTLAPQLQNAETQTEREVQEPGNLSSGVTEGKRYWGNIDRTKYVLFWTLLKKTRDIIFLQTERA